MNVASNIGNRLLVFVSLIVVVIFVGFAIIFDSLQSASINRNLIANVNENGRLADAGISNWFDGRTLLINMVSQKLATEDDQQAILDLLDLPELKSTFQYSYFGTSSGDMLIMPPSDLPADYDPRKRPWYLDTQGARTNTLTEPYQDAATGETILTVTSPVYRNSSLIGVAGGDLSLETIVTLVRNLDLGGIGYAFLVNGDGTILIHPDQALTLKPLSEAFENAPSLDATAEDMVNQSGETRFAFFKLEGLPSVDWRLGFAIDQGKAFSDLTQFRITIIITIVLAVTSLIVIQGILVRRWVSNPVRAMTSAMTNLAGGDLNVAIPATENKDEIGQMAQAVLVFKTNAARVREMEEERTRTEETAKEERKRVLTALADDFDAKAGVFVGSVSSAASRLYEDAELMSSSSETTFAQATAVTEASGLASTNVQTVAAATEELSSSISEISRQVQVSSDVAGEAVTEADRANAMVQGLMEASESIGQVVSLINDIASQTNLLALNATIEAARAGDAGKGFAVVASEVKNLANQTAQATEEISGQITNIQNATKDSVEAIGRVGSTIGRINEISASIAASVDEQGAATQEIASSVQSVTQATNEVNSSIGGVTETSSKTGKSAKDVLAAANELSDEAGKLQAEVDAFLRQVRESGSR